MTPSRFASASRRAGRGFTLVEMLAAIGVLLLLMLIIDKLLAVAQMTASFSTRSLSADAEARMVFDRMQMDIAGMLRRHDIYFQFTKQPGNDAFYFYSETAGSFDDSVGAAQQSNIALVGYDISSANQLQRLGQGQSWQQLAFLPSTFSVSAASSNYHVLGAQVFRLELAFLVREDDNTFEITDTPPAPGSADCTNLWGILVAIAVLDSDSEKLVSNFSGLDSVLGDFIGTKTLPLSASGLPDGATVDPILEPWKTALASPTFAQNAGIPKAAAAQVRIYERAFILK